MNPLANIYPNLESISHFFNGILLDAYGVFWGGNGAGLLPGSKETMERLISQGKYVGILSNSTQRAQKEIEKLFLHGLQQGKHFHFLLTSGEIANQLFVQDQLPFATPNKQFYLIGKPHPKFSTPASLFIGSPFTETTNLDRADFLYIAIPHLNGEDQTDPQLFRKQVEEITSSGLPMVCTNPDHFAHEGNPPKLVVRQGSIAKIYEELGGKVFYIGKPSELMYSAAMKQFELHGIPRIQEVLMVGDTPETDIRGANQFGIPSCLITKTGVMAERIIKKGIGAIKYLHDIPNFFIETMGSYDF